MTGAVRCCLKGLGLCGKGGVRAELFLVAHLHNLFSNAVHVL
jgi:hypothetical protein